MLEMGITASRQMQAFKQVGRFMAGFGILMPVLHGPGVSLGKANYCLQALIRLGLVKARNFRDNQNRSSYLYVLTPKGLSAKARSASRFLQLKVAEYEALQREIESLKREQLGR
ncbi:MAG: MarR family EPS-associated transcriptional regulator [Betaproteobacteria bacterium]|nr:MarR family EPS-associated transcriptional regulator [Betaproteobacteria bacterium]